MKKSYIDIAILKENIGDDDKFVIEMCKTFLEYYPGFLKGFKKACLANDSDSIQFLAHKMKSSLRLFGTSEGGDIGDYIEECLIENSPVDLKPFCFQFIQISESVIEELREMV